MTSSANPSHLLNLRLVPRANKRTNVNFSHFILKRRPKKPHNTLNSAEKLLYLAEISVWKLKFSLCTCHNILRQNITFARLRFSDYVTFLWGSLPTEQQNFNMVIRVTCIDSNSLGSHKLLLLIPTVVVVIFRTVIVILALCCSRI